MATIQVMRYICINIQLNKNTHALTEPHIILNAVISKVSMQKQILEISQSLLILIVRYFIKCELFSLRHRLYCVRYHTLTGKMRTVLQVYISQKMLKTTLLGPCHSTQKRTNA